MHLQSWLTLCDPMDCSPPGSSVHGDFPGKNTGVGCHFRGSSWLQRSNPHLLLLLHWQAGSLPLVPPFTSVHFTSVTQLSLTLCDPVDCSMPGFPVHHQCLELTQTRVYRVGDAIQPSHLLLSPSPPAPNPSQHQGLFQWVSSSHQVAKVLTFQLQHQAFQWAPRTDSLRMDWLNPLAVQGTLRNLLQHHSSKASILPCSAFFIVQLSHPFVTIGKTIALSRWTFVGKVMSLFSIFCVGWS